MPNKSDIADSREDAINCGLARYRSSSPCVHGHVGERYTLTRNCVECTKKRVLDARDRERLLFLAAKGA